MTLPVLNWDATGVTGRGFRDSGDCLTYSGERKTNTGGLDVTAAEAVAEQTVISGAAKVKGLRSVGPLKLVTLSGMQGIASFSALGAAAATAAVAVSIMGGACGNNPKLGKLSMGMDMG